VESIQRMLRDPLLPPERLNPSLATRTTAAIRRAMQVDPEDRWRSAEEFKAALLPSPPSGVGVRVASPTAPVSQPAQAPTPVPQTWRAPVPTPRRALPWGWLGAMGALGLVVVILVGLLVGSLLIGGKETPTTIPTTQAVIVLPSDTTTPRRTNPPVTLPATTEAPLFPTTLPEDFTDQYGVQMKLIPAGEFQMGRESGESDEKPVHAVYLDAFYMDVYEATNARFALCVEGGVCEKPGCDTYGNSTYDDHPVVCVDWEQARKYCEWRGARLPTEAEWEKAARGGLEGKLYPWGDESPVCEKGATNGAKFDDDAGCNATGTEPVGSYSANGYGLFDMAGNVWEWVWDWYSETYYSSSLSKNPSGPESGSYRVLRGGSWYKYWLVVRAAYRHYITPSNRTGDIGFRCAFPQE